MPKAYLVHHSQHKNNYQWDKELSEIEQINPDLVVCFCLEEFDYEFLFYTLMPRLSIWAVENNKLVKLLVPNPDNVEIFPNVYTEKTFGFYKWTISLAQLNVQETVDYYKTSDKIYTCYNHNPKYERAMLVEELAKRHLLQHGIVTFIHPDIVQNSIDHQFYGWHYHDGSKLIDEEDFALNKTIQYSANYNPKSYLRGLVDIVSESCVLEERFFLTEKTTKPVSSLKPFIALANYEYHTRFLAEEFGLELYDELFDYSFDKEKDIHKRIEKIVDNVENLVQMDRNTLLSIYESILPKLRRNRERYFNYGMNRNKMMIKTIEKLVTENFELFGDINAIEQYKFICNGYRERGWLND